MSTPMPNPPDIEDDAILKLVTDWLDEMGRWYATDGGMERKWDRAAMNTCFHLSDHLTRRER